jgi:SNF2 family DNA or RNA helicase
LVLTGTPIENSLAELWSIFDFLMPGYLYPYSYFANEYERPIVKEKDEQKQLELKNMISPFILRRRKQEVLKELPDKIETTLPIEFNEDEKKLDLANLAQVNMQLQDKLQMDQVNAIAMLAMLTRLRQICCEPRVLYDNIKDQSSKLEACMDLIRRFRETGKKILLFSSFTSVLDLIHDALNAEDISHYTLTGSTDKVKRRELVAKFQEDDTAVFLISLKAGGTGLNLTAAEAVIHFDPWWNMSAQNQATDRAHRIGQENTVQVFKLIMKDSIEEKIQQLQEAKKDLADAFVEGNDGTITSMSREDIMELFKN